MPMNILEGVKRLYICVSLLLVAAVAGTIWVEASRALCASTSIDPSAVTWDKPMTGNFWGKDELISPAPGIGHALPTLDYSAMPDGELLAGLPRRAAPVTPCPTVMERIGSATLGAVAAGAVLFIAWLVLRWVISGFLPSQTRTK